MQLALSRSAHVLTIRPTAVLLGIAFTALNFTPLLGSKAALVFLLMCLALVLRRPGDIAKESVGAGALWLLVGWCILSTFWSNAPGLTLRYSIQLALTVAIAVSAAYRLSTTSLLRVILISWLLPALASIAISRSNPGGHWVGIFSSKNALAQFASICVLSGWAVLMDRKGRGGWVFLALLNLLAGALLIYRADSAGATITTALGCIGMLAIAPMRFLSRWQRVFLGLAMGLVAVFAVLLITGFFVEIGDFVLRETGKDVTLTGRTTLWKIAFGQIALHPLLGQGFKGFWVIGNPIAESLWAQFGITTKIGFHFHNTLISNAVEIGLIGIAMQAGLVFFAAFSIFRWAIASPSAETLFLAGFVIRQLILMNSEVVFFTQFEAITLLTAMVIIYARRANAERRVIRSIIPLRMRSAPSQKTGDARYG